MSFEHYIITRFNLPIFQAKVDGRKSNACAKEYLEYRFNLFEQYCMPSIEKQTCQNFKWLVLFDNETPQEFKERASGLHDRYNNLVPCYLDFDNYKKEHQGYIALSEEYVDVASRFFPEKKSELRSAGECNHRLITPRFVMDCIRKCSSDTPDYYITTRIDNDDAFHKDMISAIQQRFKKNPRHVVFDFVYSYKYILSEGITYKFPLLNGHFITLVEPSDKLFQSVIYWNHLYVDKFVEVEHIYQYPMQTELIHGNNVINDFSDLSIEGIVYALKNFRKKDFGYENARISYGRSLYVLASLIKKYILTKV